MEKIIKKFFLFKFTLKKDKILLRKFIFLIILILVEISIIIINFNIKNINLEKLSFALGLSVIYWWSECAKDSIQSMLYIAQRKTYSYYDSKKDLLRKIKNSINKK
jgi:hypothetical protein